MISIYSFGSWGTQYERVDSDVDQAVLTKIPVDEAYLWETAQKIAIILGKNVDLVDLLRVTTAKRSKVFATSRQPYCSDKNKRECFEDYVYSSYARLNEERRDTLN